MQISGCSCWGRFPRTDSIARSHAEGKATACSHAEGKAEATPDAMSVQEWRQPICKLRRTQTTFSAHSIHYRIHTITATVKLGQSKVSPWRSFTTRLLSSFKNTNMKCQVLVPFLISSLRHGSHSLKYMCIT